MSAQYGLCPNCKDPENEPFIQEDARIRRKNLVWFIIVLAFVAFLSMHNLRYFPRSCGSWWPFSLRFRYCWKAIRTSDV